MPRTRPPYPPEFRREALSLMRSGGTRSTSAISWVLSWRLPPVTDQASGIPVASTRR